MHSEYIKRTIELASRNIDSGGGPFGAIIVRNGKVLVEASNRVTPDNDPTAHAEIVAIREAARAIGNFDLSDCILYASCEPCPMCLGAIYWARIPMVCYAADRHDAEAAGFDDSFIYDELAKPIEARKLRMLHIADDNVEELFNKWREKCDKNPY